MGNFFLAALWPAVALVGFLVLYDCVRLVTAIFTEKADTPTRLAILEARTKTLEVEQKQIKQHLSEACDEIAGALARAADAANATDLALSGLKGLNEKVDLASKLASEVNLKTNDLHLWVGKLSERVERAAKVATEAALAAGMKPERH